MKVPLVPGLIPQASLSRYPGSTCDFFTVCNGSVLSTKIRFSQVTCDLMTYGPMASKIHCCATSQLYTYVKLKPLAGTQGPQVYRLQWCLRPWEYWQQRIYPSTDMHSSSGCHHQITSWHQNLPSIFWEQSLPFFYVRMIPERCLNSLRHYSLLQGLFPPLASHCFWPGPMCRCWSSWWQPIPVASSRCQRVVGSAQANHFQGGRPSFTSAKWWIVKILGNRWWRITNIPNCIRNAMMQLWSIWTCENVWKQDSSGT